MEREEILSQEEIDALMEVFSKKNPEDEAISESAFSPSASPGDPKEVQEITAERREDEVEDWSELADRTDENWEKQKKEFEKISASLGHLLVSSLSKLLKHDVILNDSVIEQPIAYEDFLASMSSPSCIGIVASEISRITTFLELDLNLVYCMVDIVLGGIGESNLSVSRALTDFELELMKKPMQQILQNLDKVLNLKLQLEEIFIYPFQIRLNSYETVVPFLFDIMFEESKTDDETASYGQVYNLTFGLPLIALESQLNNQNTVDRDDKKEDNYYEAIKKGAFADVPLLLQANFPKTEINIGNLMEMKTGDTIDLGVQPNADVIEVELLVEGYPKFRGKLGAIGQYKAVEIL